MTNKQIKKVAMEIAKLEKEKSLQENEIEFFKKVEKLIVNCSFEDLMDIDFYIQENKLLTK